MDRNVRWVILSYIGLGIIIAWVMSQGLVTAFHFIGKKFAIYDLNKELFGLGENFTLAHLISILATSGMVFYAWKNEKIRTVSLEVVEELRKVTWPTAKETQSATILVIVSTLVITLILWIYDIVLLWVTNQIFNVPQT